MKRAVLLIPIVLITLLFVSNKAGGLGIVKPVAVDVQEKIKHYASEWGLEAALVKAIAKVESNFNPRAKNPADPSYGLMQITPGLAYDYGLISDHVNPSWLEIDIIYDVDNNLSIACWFLNRLSKYSFQQMVMSYNVGEGGYKDGRRNWDYLNKVEKYYESYS